MFIWVNPRSYSAAWTPYIGGSRFTTCSGSRPQDPTGGGEKGRALSFLSALVFDLVFALAFLRSYLPFSPSCLTLQVATAD
jgi:hypothetical protein